MNLNFASALCEEFARAIGPVVPPEFLTPQDCWDPIIKVFGDSFDSRNLAGATAQQIGDLRAAFVKCFECEEITESHLHLAIAAVLRRHPPLRTMKCPACGIEIASLPCWRCQREAANHEWEMRKLVAEFSLVRGAPSTGESRASLDFALLRMRQHLDKERFEGSISYNPDNLLRSQHWWYIPFGWVGSSGFIVNSQDGAVNWLGSALSLRDCFWGHNHGIFHNLIDFTFSPDTPKALAARLLKRFKHKHPDARGVTPDQPVWYQESELPAALSDQFPTFKRHFVWYAIPELFQAHEKSGLRFTCTLSVAPKG